MEKKEKIRSRCPVCDSKEIEYRFVTFGQVISGCLACGHLFANPQNADKVDFQPLYQKKEFQRFVKKRSFQRVKFLTSSAVKNLSEGGTTAAIAVDFIDTVSEPEQLLRQVHCSLADGGELYLFVPTLDSSSAKREKQQWEAFEQKRLQFFSNKTIQNLLCKCRFENIVLREAASNGVFIGCRAKKRQTGKLLSIIIPIYNEKNTAQELLESVYRKDLTALGLDKELIIIESNSTDGTRELIEQFAKKHPDVRVILEDKPEGKGHAVRSGLHAATGDFIMIQDGDLEYDINDYDKLLLPLIRYQEAFILGSRHTGDWRMRKFDEKVTTFLMNIGQIIFTKLINIGCGTRLKDPFTMYKLFRRECIYELTFDGNRFEIDWEIVIKLVRKGFVPLEIPINYNSRGIKEGKKIHILKDPILWLICFIRYNYLYQI